MDRSAPEDGYNFDEKAAYRRSLWRRIGEEINPAASHALLMPSIEGHEITVARKTGFDFSRLHVVDRNPAIVAHLKRRFPEIQTYGTLAHRACARMADRGIKLQAANFDLTQSVSRQFIGEVGRIAQAACWAEKAVVAFTMLRGREQETDSLECLGNYAVDAIRESRNGHAMAGVQDAYQRARRRDFGRIMSVSVVFLEFLKTLTPIKVGVYRSTAGTQTMLWALYRLQHRLDPTPFVSLHGARRRYEGWHIEWSVAAIAAHKALWETSEWANHERQEARQELSP